VASDQKDTNQDPKETISRGEMVHASLRETEKREMVRDGNQKKFVHSNRKGQESNALLVLYRTH